jgi:hypothetical protein
VRSDAPANGAPSFQCGSTPPPLDGNSSAVGTASGLVIVVVMKYQLL